MFRPALKRRTDNFRIRANPASSYNKSVGARSRSGANQNPDHAKIIQSKSVLQNWYKRDSGVGNGLFSPQSSQCSQLQAGIRRTEYDTRAPDRKKKLGVRGPDRSTKCAVVLNVPCKRSWCAVKLCPAWPRWNHMEQRPAPFRPEHSPLPARPLQI